MSWNEILRRHAVALLRDLAAELEHLEPEADSPQDEPEPAEPPWASAYRYEHATCRNCGYPVQQLRNGDAVAVPWTYGGGALGVIAGDGQGGSGRLPVGGLCGVRGCRAASYDRLGEWDESLARGWKAEPAR
jgi:hypothetical protein